MQLIPLYNYLAEIAPESPAWLHSKGSSIFFNVTMIAFFKLVQTCMAGCTDQCLQVHPYTLIEVI